MSIAAISSREFNQNPGGAKRTAEEGPVIITDCGRLLHVLRSSEDYRKFDGAGRSLLEIVAQDEDDDIDFDPQPMGGRLQDSARPCTTGVTLLNLRSLSVDAAP